MNYSSFGKELRKIMIDNDSRLYDLAKSLGVSSSFVSSVICGNKSVPEDWIPTIVKKYNLSKEEEQSLIDKMIESKNIIPEGENKTPEVKPEESKTDNSSENTTDTTKPKLIFICKSEDIYAIKLKEGQKLYLE